MTNTNNDKTGNKPATTPTPVGKWQRLNATKVSIQGHLAHLSGKSRLAYLKELKKFISDEETATRNAPALPARLLTAVSKLGYKLVKA